MQPLAPTFIPERSFTLGDDAPILPGMDIYQVRWRNFRELAGAGEHGWIQRAADRLGKAHAQVSHFGSDAPSKNIGEKVARQIEEAYGKPRGWLDNLNPSALPTVGTSPPASSSPSFNAAYVAEAEKWVRFEEGRQGPLQPLRRAERLIALYQQVEADGGSLSPEHAEAIISSPGGLHAAPDREQAARSPNHHR